MPNRLPRLLVPALFVSCAFAAAGCDVFDPSLLDGSVADAGDGGMDAGPGCMLERPPPRPDVEDGEDVDEVVFALRDIALDLDMGRWRSTGFDVDGRCTTAMDPDTECLPPSGGAPETDGERGIDNSFAHNIFPVVNLAFEGMLEDTARQNQTDGFGAVLVRLNGWNGEPNDPDVDVVISQSVFGTPADGGEAPEVVIEPNPDEGGERARLPDGGVPPLPAWDGTDYWWARKDTFLDGNPDLPRVEDTQAYVADRTIVMAVDERVDLVFTGGEQGVLVRITDVTAAFTFSEDMSTVEATVSGRWSIQDILSTAEAVGVCEGSIEHDTASSTLEDAADVLQEPGGAGEGAECDALSLGTSLTGVRANWGGLMEAKPLPDFCAEMPDGGVPDGGGGAPDAGPDGG